jgi:hypothetical protein
MKCLLPKYHQVFFSNKIEARVYKIN